MRRREQADPFIRYQYGKSTFNTEEWDTFLQIAQRPGKVLIGLMEGVKMKGILLAWK